MVVKDGGELSSNIENTNSFLPIMPIYPEGESAKVTQRGWFDCHNQTEMNAEKILKILTIYFVSNIDPTPQ